MGTGSPRRTRVEVRGEWVGIGGGEGSSQPPLLEAEAAAGDPIGGPGTPGRPSVACIRIFDPSWRSQGGERSTHRRLSFPQVSTHLQIGSQGTGGADLKQSDKSMALHRLTPSQETQLAAAAGVDPSTVRRWTRGAPIRSTSRSRIEQAVAKADLPAGLCRAVAALVSPFPSQDGSTSPPGASSPRWGA